MYSCCGVHNPCLVFSLPAHIATPNSSLLSHTRLSFFFVLYFLSSSSCPKSLFSLHNLLPLSQPITLSILICHSSWSSSLPCVGLRLCLSSGSRSGVSWFQIAGLSSWQHRRWNLQSSLSVSLSWEWSLMENTCLYRIQNICSGKINGSTSFAIDNMYYVSFWIWEQECVPWCGEIQNRKSKVLEKTFNLHSNST